MNKKITVFGLGYVGTSIAILLSQNNEVTAIDVDEKKVNMINKGLSPIDDSLATYFLKNKKLNLKAFTKTTKLDDSDFVVLCLPTNFNEDSNSFDTSILEETIRSIKETKKDLPIIIKSTIPVGFTDKMIKIFDSSNIYFSPEFLREGTALHDNLNPNRIIISSNNAEAKEFVRMLESSSDVAGRVPTLFTNPREAESIKLFANTYLAMRVAFFNELDSFCLVKNLNTKHIIEGISYDDRIGNHYNNPSFGYGGYCLPKDSKQLLSNYDGTPQNLVEAIVSSNKTRKNFLANEITKLGPKKVGIFKLAMKKDSDNFRDSSILGIMSLLSHESVELIIYEPSIKQKSFNNFKVCKDLDKFKNSVDLIIANRISEELDDVKSKVFTRDLFQNN